MNDIERSLMQHKLANEEWINGGSVRARMRALRSLLEIAKKREWAKTKITEDAETNRYI